MHSRLFFLHALTSLHAGIGQGSGVIDLPIARERSTHLPIVPGSSIKGVLRDTLSELPESTALFGPKTDNAADHAGALALTDARLLCLPVRALGGTFAWLTCPLVLQRFQRDWQALYPEQNPLQIPQPGEDRICVVNQHTVLATGTAPNQQVVLEDIDLTVERTDLKEWAQRIAGPVFAGQDDWQKIFHQHFALVSNAVFDFLAETATEIVTRIRLQEGTRTVARGGLWFEEHLPAESLLWGIAAADRARNGQPLSGEELLTLLPNETRLQVGGKATVGRGQVRWLLK
jgi:CRISPR-associated protein Cmr4